MQTLALTRVSPERTTQNLTSMTSLPLVAKSNSYKYREGIEEAGSVNMARFLLNSCREGFLLRRVGEFSLLLQLAKVEQLFRG